MIKQPKDFVPEETFGHRLVVAVVLLFILAWALYGLWVRL